MAIKSENPGEEKKCNYAKLASGKNAEAAAGFLGRL